MSKTTFTWRPEFESQLTQAPKVTTIKFGDGYEQRTPSGINNAPEKWSLQFTVSSAATNSALTFIQARGAVESFYWTNPFGQTKTYICKEWKLSRRQGHNVMNFDFEQVFEA